MRAPTGVFCIDPDHEPSRPQYARYMARVTAVARAVCSSDATAARGALAPVQTFLNAAIAVDVGDAGCDAMVAGLRAGIVDIAAVLDAERVDAFVRVLDQMVREDYNGVWAASVATVKPRFLLDVAERFTGAVAGADTALPPRTLDGLAVPEFATGRVRLD